MLSPDWRKYAEDALQVQDACNPLGVSRAIGDTILKLYNDMGRPGFDEFTTHPNVRAIVGLWVSKLDSLFQFPTLQASTYEDACKLAGK